MSIPSLKKTFKVASILAISAIGSSPAIANTGGDDWVYSTPNADTYYLGLGHRYNVSGVDGVHLNFVSNIHEGAQVVGDIFLDMPEKIHTTPGDDIITKGDGSINVDMEGGQDTFVLPGRFSQYRMDDVPDQWGGHIRIIDFNNPADEIRIKNVWKIQFGDGSIVDGDFTYGTDGGDWIYSTLKVDTNYFGLGHDRYNVSGVDGVHLDFVTNIHEGDQVAGDIFLDMPEKIHTTLGDDIITKGNGPINVDMEGGYDRLVLQDIFENYTMRDIPDEWGGHTEIVNTKNPSDLAKIKNVEEVQFANGMFNIKKDEFDRNAIRLLRDAQPYIDGTYCGLQVWSGNDMDNLLMGIDSTGKPVWQTFLDNNLVGGNYNQILYGGHSHVTLLDEILSEMDPETNIYGIDIIGPSYGTPDNPLGIVLVALETDPATGQCDQQKGVSTLMTYDGTYDFNLEYPILQESINYLETNYPHLLNPTP